MRSRPWQVRGSWLCEVALATALAVAWPAHASVDPPGGPAPPAQDDSSSLRLAAIAPPPEAPQPRVLPGAIPPVPPAEEQFTAEPPVAEPPEPAEASGGDAPAPADPRVEEGGSVPSATPPPSYPVVVNGHVEALIDYFSARERERFGLWIARSGRYLGMIQRIFREHGLPEELGYTAMIESGFSPRAVSRVGAKGMWQFMEATGRRYGLLVNRWVDERLDPVKSTIAAARYLGDLHGMFGHWFLAQAAYNAGEARVGRAIQRARTSDFWALTQTRHLPDETKMFVPQILAATVITREPGRYGFDVTMQPPLDYDEVTVKRALDLDAVAELAEVSVDEIRDLNPSLLGRITPPFGAFPLRLPVGAGARFEAALRDAPPGRLPVWGIHRIARSQTLADVARLYRTTPQRLAEVNHLPGGRLRGVSEVLVPVSSRVTTAAAAPPAERAAGPREVMRPASRPAAGAAAREVVVQRGDTLWAIAARHGLKPQALARLNGMDADDRLIAGARLRVATP